MRAQALICSETQRFSLEEVLLPEPTRDQSLMFTQRDTDENVGERTCGIFAPH